MTEQHEVLAKELVNALTQFSKNVNKILEETFSLEGKTEKDLEMKYSYKNGDEYWFIFDNGHIDIDCWEEHATDCDRFKIGNAYPTEEAAELEAKRRNLLTRFRAFRDECNGDWKADWNDKDERKWCFYYSIPDDIFSIYYSIWNQQFALFGYFKNGEDAERAIELFGDEIKELFVECEG